MHLYLAPYPILRKRNTYGTVYWCIKIKQNVKKKFRLGKGLRLSPNIRFFEVPPKLHLIFAHYAKVL